MSLRAEEGTGHVNRPHVGERLGELACGLCPTMRYAGRYPSREHLRNSGPRVDIRGRTRELADQVLVLFGLNGRPFSLRKPAPASPLSHPRIGTTQFLGFSHTSGRISE
jgi:hypothetical protein